MTDHLPILMLSFAASVGLTPLTRRLARQIGLVDSPKAHKFHRKPTPLMGGLAIYLGFVVALLLAWRAWDDSAYLLEFSVIIVGATFLAILGFVDDRKVLSPGMKTLGQLSVAIAVMIAGVRVDLFNSSFDWLITLFWIIGIINAINFLDNMDGLAAGVSAIVAGFIFVIAANQGQELVSALAGALCGAAIGFLLYNFNPASTFMGDLGSLVLGFVLAVLGIKLRFLSQPLTVSWLIPIMVFAIPIFDTTLVTFTRLRERRSPMQGGKDHTSHRLVYLGLSARAAVIVIYIMTGICGGAALIASLAPPNIVPVIAAVLAATGLIAFVFLEWARIRQTREQHSASRNT